MSSNFSRLAERIGHPDARFEDRAEVREAIALLLLSVAAADAELAPEEQQVMQRLMLSLPVFKNSVEEATRCFYRALKIFNGADALNAEIDVAWSRFEDVGTREVMATMILATIVADGRRDDAEATVGSHLIGGLEVKAARVVELMAHAEAFVAVLLEGASA